MYKLSYDLCSPCPILQPLGRQYNPDSAFRDLTRPAILKSTGVVIDPVRYSKPLAKHTNEVRWWLVRSMIY